ncbi:MAG: hypothetical protein ABF785_11110, partial [Acetobacter papayae]
TIIPSPPEYARVSRRMLTNKLLFSMDVWVAIHPDMRNDRRIRLMFDYLVRELTHYAKTSRHKV